MLPDDVLQEARTWFPILGNKTYLNSHAKGALSKQVASAIQTYVESWNDFGSPWDLWLGKIEQIRGTFARLIKADFDEIAITFCVSTAMSTIASCLDFRGRDKVIIASDEFPTLIHLWLAQKARGAKVEFVEKQPGLSLLEAYERVIDEHTAIVIAHHIHHITGALLDIQKLAEYCHQHGAYLCVDAYQSVGVIDLDVKKLDIDFLITGTMKYLLGSAGGVAYLYVKRKLISSFEPLYTGWFSQVDPFQTSQDHLDYAQSARRFESGLQPICSVYAALAGLEIINRIGILRIEDHVRDLSKHFLEIIEQSNVKILTDAPSVYPGPMFAIQTLQDDNIVQAMSKANIVAAGWKNTVRFSFHFYNTIEEVEWFARMLLISAKGS